MLIIVDFRAPVEAIESLKIYGTVVLFNASNITYQAVCGHPDIFIFQLEDSLVIAPNTPLYIIDALNRHDVLYTLGDKPVGSTLENSSQYNVICSYQNSTISDSRQDDIYDSQQNTRCSTQYIYHKLNFTDAKVLELTNNFELIALPQAYTRCSMFMLDSNTAITSDAGIKRAIDSQSSINCHLFSPNGIQLPPYKNGFLGGCIGKIDNDIVIMGSLKYLEDGDALRRLIKSKGLNVVELYDGPLYDGGGIFFINKTV